MVLRVSAHTHVARPGGKTRGWPSGIYNRFPRPVARDGDNYRNCGGDSKGNGHRVTDRTGIARHETDTRNFRIVPLM